LSVRAVVGEFTDAAPGFGFRGEGDRVAFDHPDALWKTIHFELRVDENLGGDGASPVRVGFGVGGETDFQKTKDGLIALGRVALLLTPSPVFAYDEGPLAIVEDAELLLEIDAEERLSLPFIDDESQASSFLQNTATLGGAAARSFQAAEDNPIAP